MILAKPRLLAAPNGSPRQTGLKPGELNSKVCIMQAMLRSAEMFAQGQHNLQTKMQPRVHPACKQEIRDAPCPR